MTSLLDPTANPSALGHVAQDHAAAFGSAAESREQGRIKDHTCVLHGLQHLDPSQRRGFDAIVYTQRPEPAG